MALLDTQTAKELAAKSHEARRRNKELREAEQHMPQPEPQIAQPKPDYISDRLARVRTQIDMLSDMLEAEEDPNKLDRLANAISRMSELERQLAGRPLPGSLKPTQARQAQRSATVEPIGPAPQTSAIQVMPEQRNPGPGGPGQG